jgi:hypothetical protein
VQEALFAVCKRKRVNFNISKQEQLWFIAGEERQEGLRQFLEDNTYKPDLGMYKRPEEE